MARYTGRCLCGAIRFEIDGDVASPLVCHCEQCRRQSGHCVAAAEADKSAVTLIEDRGLKWFRSSKEVRRGFCGECGSALFFDDGGSHLSFNLGALDQPTGLRLSGHIFVANKADYYEIADDLPQFAARPPFVA